MPARVHTLDFLVPDGLELLRRDRRGSAVAFHAGTTPPQNPPDKGGQAVTIQSEFNAKAQRRQDAKMELERKARASGRYRFAETPGKSEMALHEKPAKPK